MKDLIQSLETEIKTRKIQDKNYDESELFVSNEKYIEQLKKEFPHIQKELSKIKSITPSKSPVRTKSNAKIFNERQNHKNNSTRSISPLNRSEIEKKRSISPCFGNNDKRNLKNIKNFNNLKPKETIF